MAYKITTFDNRDKSTMASRDTASEAYTRTVHINQTDGNFLVALPVENKITIYGQSPNSSNSRVGKSISITDLDAYGEFDFPMDAKFDFINRKIWVADTGNNRLLCLNYNTLLVEYEITNIIFPCSITVNPNNGDIFVRGFANLTTGCIYWMDTNGKTIDTILFPDAFPYVTFEITNDVQTGQDFPSALTVDFDHVRSRLWWTVTSQTYMADLITKNISSLDLSEFEFIGPIKVDINSGNSLVGAGTETGVNAKFSNVVCVYKDNNIVLETMKVALSVRSPILSPLSTPNIEPGQSSPWPTEFIVSDFDNLGMNGIWQRNGNYRGQLYSYVCPNNTLVFSDSNPSGQYGIGSYILQPSGNYQWEFIFYKIENYPVISQKWIYRQQSNSKMPSGEYLLSSYYSADPLDVNPYPNDSGYIDVDEFSDSSLSSISSYESESSSSMLETESYEAQIITGILVDSAGHHNLLPFAFSVDNPLFSKNSNSIPFTFSNATSLDYSSMFKTNGISSSWLQSASNTYVPQPDSAKYTHENEVFIDVITSNVIAVSSSKVSSMQNNLHEMVPTEKFTIPKFTWKINQVEIKPTIPVIDPPTSDSTFFARLSEDFSNLFAAYEAPSPLMCVKDETTGSDFPARYLLNASSTKTSVFGAGFGGTSNSSMTVYASITWQIPGRDNGVTFVFIKDIPSYSSYSLTDLIGEWRPWWAKRRTTYINTNGVEIGTEIDITSDFISKSQTNNWKFSLSKISEEDFAICGSTVSEQPTETRECNPYIQLSTGFYDPGLGLSYVLASRRPDTCLETESYQYERQIGEQTDDLFHKVFVSAYIDTNGIRKTRVEITVKDPDTVVAGRTYLRASYLNKQSYLENETPVVLGDYELAWTTPQELGDILAQNTLPIAIYASTKEDYDASGGT